MIHQTTDGGIFALLVLTEVHAVNDGTHDDRTYLAEFIVDGHGGCCRFNVQPRTDGLIVEEGTHGPSKRLRRQEVRSVWENLDVEHVLVTAVDVRSEEGKGLLQSGDAVLMTGFCHQGPQHALLDADGRHVFTSSNRATGVQTQRPANRSSRLHPASLRAGVRARARRCLTGQGLGGETSCLLVGVAAWPQGQRDRRLPA